MIIASAFDSLISVIVQCTENKENIKGPYSFIKYYVYWHKVTGISHGTNSYGYTETRLELILLTHTWFVCLGQVYKRFSRAVRSTNKFKKQKLHIVCPCPHEAHIKAVIKIYLY
jgi:hypothetical protein